MQEVLKNNRINRRIHELLSKAATSAAPFPTPGQRELHFVFFRKPERFLESDARSGHVAGVNFERTIVRGKTCTIIAFLVYFRYIVLLNLSFLFFVSLVA